MHGDGPPCSAAVDERQCVGRRERGCFGVRLSVGTNVRRALAAGIAGNDGCVAENTEHGFTGFEDGKFQFTRTEFVEKLLARFARAVSLRPDETGVENLSKRGHVRCQHGTIECVV